MKNILIAFFSLEHTEPIGVTHEVANNLQRLTGGDLFKIEPVHGYPESFKEINKEAAQKKQENARPPLKNHLENPDDYQIVFLAYPNYWSTMPMEVFTFIENLDFTGKKVYPICTNEGSGLGHSVIDLIKMIGQDQVGPVLALNRNERDTSYSALKKYLQDIMIKTVD